MLSSNEIAVLTADVQDLIDQVRTAKNAESDGGKAVTRTERRRLVRSAMGLALRAALAIID